MSKIKSFADLKTVTETKKRPRTEKFIPSMADRVKCANILADRLEQLDEHLCRYKNPGDSDHTIAEEMGWPSHNPVAHLRKEIHGMLQQGGARQPTRVMEIETKLADLERCHDSLIDHLERGGLKGLAQFKIN